MNGGDPHYSLEQRPVYPLPVYGTLFCPNQLIVFLGGTGPPSPLMFPWKYFLLYEMGKKQGNQKRALLHKGRFSYSCVLLRFGNTLVQAHALECPSLRRTCSYGNFPYNKRGNTVLVLKAPYFILFTH
jgi:hypothetical protein